MEMLNISRTGEGIFRALLLATLIGVVGCAAPAKRGTPNPTAEKVAPHEEPRGEVYGPFPTSAPSAPPVSDPDRIVLVFGKGLTHGFAYVGVLRALQELKVPVHAIYATETGALAGALYFTQKNLNRIDWALLRFNEKNLGKREGKISFRLSSPEKALEESLQEVFGETRLESIADRLHVWLEDTKTEESFDARSGSLSSALRGALAGANEYAPAELEGRNVRASNTKLSELYQRARETEKYPVVVVAAGAPPTELFRKLLENEKSTLLYVPLPGMDDLEIKRRNQAVFSGKNAVHKAAKEILSLVGRKSE
jgi:predicted acylesterase/phospholipase RssA